MGWRCTETGHGFGTRAGVQQQGVQGGGVHRETGGGGGFVMGWVALRFAFGGGGRRVGPRQTTSESAKTGCPFPPFSPTGYATWTPVAHSVWAGGHNDRDMKEGK